MITECTYRASGAGGSVVNLTSAFTGVPSLNGQWKLRFEDVSLLDGGTVLAASLRIDAAGD